MKQYLAFIYRTSGPVALKVLLISGLAGVSSALLIALVGDVFDDVENGLDFRPVLGAAALVVALSALEYLAKLLLIRHSEALADDFRLNLVAWQVRQPLAATESKGPTPLVSAFSEDVRRVCLGLEYIPEVGISLAAILGGAVYLTWVSWPIMALAVVAVVPAAWVFMKIQKRVQRALLDTLGARDRANDYFKSIVNGMKEIKLDRRREGAIVERHLGPTSASLSEASQRLAMGYAAGSLWTQFCYFSAIIAVLALVALDVVDPAVVAPYILVALFLKSYIYRFMAALPFWTTGGAVIGRLAAEGFVYRPRERLDHPPPVGERPPGDARGLTIEVRDVCYTYVSERDTRLFTAGPFELKLDKPEIVFVTGQNGAGKSTFLKTLCGLYRPESGSLTLDGVEITDANRQTYRNHFAAIFTVPHVFRELPFEPPETEERRALFRHYLGVLQLDAKIDLERTAKLPELSHGQTKRLALLGALMDERPVVVFDEWAENQDPQYKRTFYYDILPRLRDAGKIVVAVTHESHYFDAADRIYELRSGRDAPPEPVPGSVRRTPALAASGGA